MINLEETKFLPDGFHDINGTMQEIDLTGKDVEKICREIIENEFMDEVADWGCDIDEILDDCVGMGDTYAEALSTADWNCKKYYVNIDECNNVRLFKILSVYENLYNSNVFNAKEKHDGIYDFHVMFEADEDDLCCLSCAIDKCVFDKKSSQNIQ